jgi:uncharacterized DUF497 family protein/predicted DNA binding CopG/RHH family protein
VGILDEFIEGMEGFEWDAGNSDKNWLRHSVRQAEAEQALLNRPLVFVVDLMHSQQEGRFFALGRTDAARRLAVVFTVRGTWVRVISARAMSKMEDEFMRKRKHGLKAIPKFRTEAEERRFWETHDSTEYVDWSKAEFVRFPNLKPSTETISLRLPAPLLADLKALANKRDVPYQSLLKIFLADRVVTEWRMAGGGDARSNERFQPEVARGYAGPGARKKATPSELKRRQAN